MAAIHAGAFPQGWGAADIAALLLSPGCCARWVPGQAFILVRAVLDEAEIITLATVPARRRQGLAQALVGQAGALCLAQGVTVLHLEVAAGNVPAQALYAGLGFVRVGRRPGYYADGSDAWLLRLNLCAAADVHLPG
ncbi:MAG: GNAT family N-acetyltransferase [Rubritepida sp.]|nr:GNAT family N-acetyltransferase [Rubritepida sp.]